MKTIPLTTSLVLAAGLWISPATPARAAAVATPSTPAPAVAVADPASSLAPTAARPAVDRVIFVPRLPTAGELTAVAQAQNLSILQIDQTAADVTIVYQLSDGRRSAVSYQLLSNTGAATQPAVVTGATTPTVVYYTPTPTPAPTRVYYYGSPAVYVDPFYYPWYGPVSVRLGFGWNYHSGGHGGWHHGGYHGRH